jgi:hypothetical protein
MSENGEIYTAGNKFYTPAGIDGMDKFHLWSEASRLMRDSNTSKSFLIPRQELTKPCLMTYCPSQGPPKFPADIFENTLSRNQTKWPST